MKNRELFELIIYRHNLFFLLDKEFKYNQKNNILEYEEYRFKDGKLFKTIKDGFISYDLNVKNIFIVSGYMFVKHGFSSTDRTYSWQKMNIKYYWKNKKLR